MQQFDPSWLMRLASTTAHISARVNSFDPATSLAGDRIGKSLARSVLSELTDLESQCSQMDLKCSLATCRKISALVHQSPAPTFAQLVDLQKELAGRVEDELKCTILLALDAGEAEVYSHFREGWEEVLQRFPEALTDIEESRKCFSLARYPASIYHSLQVVEVALIELGILLEISDPKSGWTAVTNRLKSVVGKTHQQRTTFEARHFGTLEQIYGTVEALKNAWRNKISHAQGRLVLISLDLSREIAEEILVATRAFVRRLALELPRED